MAQEIEFIGPSKKLALDRSLSLITTTIAIELTGVQVELMWAYIWTNDGLIADDLVVGIRAAATVEFCLRRQIAGPEVNTNMPSFAHQTWDYRNAPRLNGLSFNVSNGGAARDGGYEIGYRLIPTPPTS